MSNVDSILFLNGVLIFLCEYQSFMIIEIVMSILFTGVFLFKWIRSFQQPQDQVSVILNGVCFIRLQVAFVFPALPPFFFKDSYFLIKYPFIDGKSLHSFLSIFLSGDSHVYSNGASSSSLFTRFLLRWFKFKRY